MPCSLRKPYPAPATSTPPSPRSTPRNSRSSPGRGGSSGPSPTLNPTQPHCQIPAQPPSGAMQISRTDLADFSYFLAIAKHRSFRRAGLELGVSASALSHALKGLETRLGVRLLNRTNRSVTLTAAGEELRDAITQPFSAIGQAVENLNRYRDAPTGRIRLNVVVDAAALLLGPVLPVFADR